MRCSRTCSRSPPAPASPNVLLVTIDTLRADRVGAYGYARAATPDAGPPGARGRARGGGRRPGAADAALARLDPHRAPALRARDPRQQLAAARGARCPLWPPSCAGRLRHGRRSWAPTRSRAPSGLDRGFDLVRRPVRRRRARDRPRSAEERRAAEVVDAALEWLARPRARPVLPWVHLFDPHAPYEPPAAASGALRRAALRRRGRLRGRAGRTALGLAARAGHAATGRWWWSRPTTARGSATTAKTSTCCSSTTRRCVSRC